MVVINSHVLQQSKVAFMDPSSLTIVSVWKMHWLIITIITIHHLIDAVLRYIIQGNPFPSSVLMPEYNQLHFFFPDGV